jgi:hypothetical protein
VELQSWNWQFLFRALHCPHRSVSRRLTSHQRDYSPHRCDAIVRLLKQEGTHTERALRDHGVALPREHQPTTTYKEVEMDLPDGMPFRLTLSGLLLVAAVTAGALLGAVIMVVIVAIA